ncbi:MAG: hypothetical protein ACE5GJ_02575 [Gemmatimonadota bacterium]
MKTNRANPGWARGAVTAAAVLLVAGLAALAGGAFQEEGFPHADHEKLFPVCTGCHEGVETGEAATLYPEVQACERCHNGVDEDRVAWSGPSPRAGNVRFDHVQHASDLEEAGDSARACGDCHGHPGGTYMDVADTVQVETCFSCHAHEARRHEEDAACAVCHVPLAETGWEPGRMEELPVPSDHERSGFVLEGHGKDAATDVDRCATCHTQERCTSCHVATDLSAIQGVAAAPPDMRLPLFVAHYPEPASHEDEGWLSAHGVQAGAADCDACHTADDCLTCHVARVPDVVAEMPARADVAAPGVGLEARPPGSHASLFFPRAHATLAAVDDGSCMTCHEESYCVACHDGPSNGGYHPADFVTRHSADAYGQEQECATCHNAAAFCRQCHLESGMGSSGRLGPGFHDAEPLWLLRHGQAARQNLEGCVSCHEQKECLQCHGILGAFKVSPHSREFDARAAWARNPRSCLACHLRNPLEGNGS